MYSGEFIEHGVEIVIGVIEIEPRRDGEDELDAVLVGDGDQFSQAFDLKSRVRIPPLSAMIGIVLRGVDVSVELMSGAELNEVEALTMRPGLTVEAFDDAADGNGIGGNKRSRNQDESGDGRKDFEQ